jgi:Cu/Ag efflux protein CusF
MNILNRLPWISFALPLALPGCSGGPTTGPQGAGDGGYDLKGKVVIVDAANKAVTLDHEEIPGLMKAMKDMPFQVEDAKLLQGLKPGDAVEERVKKAQSGGPPIITRLEKR